MREEARASPGTVRFGVFEVDLKAGELRKQGIRIKVQDQPFQILKILLERPGEVVTREELQQRIWPADTFVDFDHGLNNAIKRLRDALSDDADQSTYIETLPKRGYRFIAPVTPRPPGPSPIGRGETESLFQPSPLGRGWPRKAGSGEGLEPHGAAARRLVALAVGLVVVLAALLGLVVGGLRDRLMSLAGASVSRRMPPPKIESIAVLPLENLSRDPDQEYFADGMTEELITDLSQIGALKVISRTSVMRYKKTDKRLPEIARELGVDAVVEGTVLRSGDQVRITAQLIQGTTDKHLWGASFERGAEDVLALQREVARAIAEQVQVTLAPQEQAHLTRARPVNPKTLDAYLAGRYCLNKSIDLELRKGQENSSEEEFRKAVRYFEEAVREDPMYARAHLGLYEALSSPQVPHLDLLPRAEAEVEKALALDETLVEAHVAKACLLTQYEHEWGWSGPGREFRRVLELAPNSATAHGGFADYLIEMGLQEEAQKEKTLERQLHSYDPTIRNFGNQDQLEGLRQYLDKIKSTDPGWHWYLAKCLEASGRKDEAIAEWEKTMTLAGFTELADALARGYARGGYKGALGEWVKGLEEESKHRYIPRITLAMAYVDLDDKDRAFAWLEKAYEERNYITSFLKQEVGWDPIRSDPRFKDLLRRVGLPP